MMNPLRLLVFGSFLLALAGCGSVGGMAKSMGVGRRPLIEYVVPPAFTEKETATLTRWMAEEKDLFAKLQKHNNKNADAIATYNADAVSINLTQNALVNDGDKDAARAAVRVQIQKAKYPAGHPIYKLVNGDAEKTP